MTEYRKAKIQIIYDVLSQIKELYPAKIRGIYEDVFYQDTQEKLYRLGKKYGLIKTFYKLSILDRK